MTPVVHHEGDCERHFKKCHPEDLKNWGRFCQIVLDTIVKEEESLGAGCTIEVLDHFFAKEKNREAIGMTEDEFENDFKLRTLLTVSLSCARTNFTHLSS